MIEQETINQINAVADIVDVVSDFVELKRSGSGFKGLCPFHNEKTPSFSVSPSLGICKCFSCGKGGGPINFIMEHEHMTYIEAIRYLAKKYHIEIKETNLTDEERSARLEREELVKLTACVQTYFTKKLSEDNNAKSTLIQLGITESSITSQRFGLFPIQHNDLIEHIKSNGLNPNHLDLLGLSNENPPLNHDAISLPITNIAGAIIGFAFFSISEILEASATFSAKNNLFKVEDNLFCFSSARQFIVKNNLSYLTLKILDCAIMQQSGLENTVALIDSELTENHCRMLKRLSNNLCIIIAKGDSIPDYLSKLILANGFSFSIVQIPEENLGKFILNNNSQYITNYLSNNSQNYVQWVIDAEIERLQNNRTNVNEAFAKIIKTIAAINSQITRTLYAQYVSSKMHIDEKLISHEIEKYTNFY